MTPPAASPGTENSLLGSGRECSRSSGGRWPVLQGSQVRLGNTPLHPAASLVTLKQARLVLTGKVFFTPGEAMSQSRPGPATHRSQRQTPAAWPQTKSLTPAVSPALLQNILAALGHTFPGGKEAPGTARHGGCSLGLPGLLPQGAVAPSSGTSERQRVLGHCPLSTGHPPPALGLVPTSRGILSQTRA